MYINTVHGVNDNTAKVRLSGAGPPGGTGVQLDYTSACAGAAGQLVSVALQHTVVLHVFGQLNG